MFFYAIKYAIFSDQHFMQKTYSSHQKFEYTNDNICKEQNFLIPMEFEGLRD